MKVTNIEELNEAIRLDIYNVEYIKESYLNESTVIDEDKSVKWNREEVARLNEEMKVKVQNNRQLRRDMENKQREDIIRAYANESGYSENKVALIYVYAYNESHSSGMYEVIQTLDSLIDLFQEVDEVK